MMFFGGAPVLFSGCCIRFGKPTKDNPIGIYIHHNDAHASVGVGGIDLDSRGRIVVDQSWPGGPIITMGAWADETMVARGLSFGCSGGTGETVIVSAGSRQLDLNDPDDYKLLEGPYSNVWLFWMHLDRSSAKLPKPDAY